eukprot:9472207-Pyramimonas_sp.AAC.1
MVNAMLEFREAVTELGAIINDKLVIVGTTLSLAQGIASRLGRPASVARRSAVYVGVDVSEGSMGGRPGSAHQARQAQ